MQTVAQEKQEEVGNLYESVSGKKACVVCKILKYTILLFLVGLHLVIIFLLLIAIGVFELEKIPELISVIIVITWVSLSAAITLSTIDTNWLKKKAGDVSS